jgi:hypothetical protein
VHPLTFFLRSVLAFIRTWYGIASISVTTLASLYYGIPKMSRTWEWYCDKYDAKVLAAVKVCRETTDASHNPPIFRTLPQTVDTISANIRRSPKSVEKSLQRLKRRGKAKFIDSGWEAL